MEYDPKLDLLTDEQIKRLAIKYNDKSILASCQLDGFEKATELARKADECYKYIDYRNGTVTSAKTILSRCGVYLSWHLDAECHNNEHIIDPTPPVGSLRIVK